jgi:uncharacterized protein (TIGR02145 family)
MKPLRFIISPAICLAVCIFFTTVMNAQVTDLNGKTYSTVKIGAQEWMAENLDVSKFRNGDPIPEAKTSAEWAQAGENGKPAWCYYNHDPVMGRLYGKLYNWYAVNDPRGLAPAGWHVPGDPEWTTLINYLGGDSVAGGKMKNITGWNESYGDGGPYAKDARLVSGNGTNTSGFAALPAGEINYGTSAGLGIWCYFWSSSAYGYDNLLRDDRFAYHVWMRNYSSYIFRDNHRKWEGYSCRCVRD